MAYNTQALVKTAWIDSRLKLGSGRIYFKIPPYTEINPSDNDFKYPSHHDTNNENTHAQEKR